MELRRQDEALPAPMGIRAEVASNPGVETPDGPKTHREMCGLGMSIRSLRLKSRTRLPFIYGSLVLARTLALPAAAG